MPKIPAPWDTRDGRPHVRRNLIQDLLRTALAAVTLCPGVALDEAVQRELPPPIGSRSRTSSGASAGSKVSRSMSVMYGTDVKPFMPNPFGVRCCVWRVVHFV